VVFIEYRLPIYVGMAKLCPPETATADRTTRFLGDSGLSGSTMSRDVFLRLPGPCSSR
jgi:hypothetical protein